MSDIFSPQANSGGLTDAANYFGQLLQSNLAAGAAINGKLNLPGILSKQLALPAYGGKVGETISGNQQDLLNLNNSVLQKYFGGGYQAPMVGFNGQMSPGGSGNSYSLPGQNNVGSMGVTGGSTIGAPGQPTTSNGPFLTPPTDSNGVPIGGLPGQQPGGGSDGGGTDMWSQFLSMLSNGGRNNQAPGGQTSSQYFTQNTTPNPTTGAGALSVGATANGTDPTSLYAQGKIDFPTLVQMTTKTPQQSLQEEYQALLKANNGNTAGARQALLNPAGYTITPEKTALINSMFDQNGAPIPGAYTPPTTPTYNPQANVNSGTQQFNPAGTNQGPNTNPTASQGMGTGIGQNDALQSLLSLLQGSGIKLPGGSGGASDVPQNGGNGTSQVTNPQATLNNPGVGINSISGNGPAGVPGSDSLMSLFASFAQKNPGSFDPQILAMLNNPGVSSLNSLSAGGGQGQQGLLNIAGQNPAAAGQPALSSAQDMIKSLASNPALLSLIGGQNQTGTFNNLASSLEAQRQQQQKTDTGNLREQFSANGLRFGTDLAGAIGTSNTNSQTNMNAQLASLIPTLTAQNQQGQVSGLNLLSSLPNILANLGGTQGQLALGGQANATNALSNLTNSQVGAAGAGAGAGNAGANTLASLFSGNQGASLQALLASPQALSLLNSLPYQLAGQQQSLAQGDIGLTSQPFNQQQIATTQQDTQDVRNYQQYLQTQSLFPQLISMLGGAPPIDYSGSPFSQGANVAGTAASTAIAAKTLQGMK